MSLTPLLKRRFLGTYHNSLGQPEGGKEIILEALRDVGANGILTPNEPVTVITSNQAGHIGEYDFELYTVDSSFISYRVTLPNGKTPVIDVAPGAATSLDAEINLSTVPETLPFSVELLGALMSLINSNGGGNSDGEKASSYFEFASNPTSTKDSIQILTPISESPVFYYSQEIESGTDLAETLTNTVNFLKHNTSISLTNLEFSTDGISKVFVTYAVAGSRGNEVTLKALNSKSYIGKITVKGVELPEDEDKQMRYANLTGGKDSIEEIILGKASYLTIPLYENVIPDQNISIGWDEFAVIYFVETIGDDSVQSQIGATLEETIDNLVAFSDNYREQRYGNSFDEIVLSREGNRLVIKERVIGSLGTNQAIVGNFSNFVAANGYVNLGAGLLGIVEQVEYLQAQVTQQEQNIGNVSGRADSALSSAYFATVNIDNFKATKGAANGLAPLDGAGKVASQYLSYANDVYYNVTGNPISVPTVTKPVFAYVQNTTGTVDFAFNGIQNGVPIEGWFDSGSGIIKLLGTGFFVRDVGSAGVSAGATGIRFSVSSGHASVRFIRYGMTVYILSKSGLLTTTAF